jgi:hypothetical protein
MSWNHTGAGQTDAMGIEYLALVQIAFWRALARRIQTLDVQK